MSFINNFLWTNAWQEDSPYLSYHLVKLIENMDINFIKN